ncbi:MAG: hypothetical protein HY716_13060 [Planctomycetes bacterium]|nr:hypothetical protein [Planctomycetota bacterium]
MASKMCANHPKAPATTQCHQCKKDLCKSCVMVTPSGTFCSSECSILYRETKVQSGREGKKTSAGKKMVLVLLLLLVGAAVAVHLTAKGSPYDVIGKLMSR